MMLVPITVHVPEHLVPRFYEQFGDLVSKKSATDALPAPKKVAPHVYEPAWVESEDAAELAWALWKELSLLGAQVLLYLAREVGEEPKHFTPEEIAVAMRHPKGPSGIAGVLGGVGKAIRRAGLPMYTSRLGGAWHFVWDWDGAVYTMTPAVARLLREADTRRD
jgi:hypothetical protein